MLQSEKHFKKSAIGCIFYKTNLILRICYLILYDRIQVFIQIKYLNSFKALIINNLRNIFLTIGISGHFPLYQIYSQSTFSKEQFILSKERMGAFTISDIQPPQNVTLVPESYRNKFKKILKPIKIIKNEEMSDWFC